MPELTDPQQTIDLHNNLIRNSPPKLKLDRILEKQIRITEITIDNYKLLIDEDYQNLASRTITPSHRLALTNQLIHREAEIHYLQRKLILLSLKLQARRNNRTDVSAFIPTTH